VVGGGRDGIYFGAAGAIVSDLKHMDEATAVLKRVDTQVAMLASAENGLERGYAYLGYLLLEVYEMQYWRVHFSSFREYLNDIGSKFNRSAGRLQQYFLTVRDLSDTFTRPQLEAMGITKAIQLRQAKDYAIVLPGEMCAAALDPKITATDLKKLIATLLHMPKDEDGDWMECKMEFMVSPEQRATIQDAINAAMHTDPVTKSTISESAQMLDVMMKLSMEYLGAHSGDGQ